MFQIYLLQESGTPADMFSDMMDLFVNLGINTYITSAIMAVIVIAVTGALLSMIANR